MPLIGNARSMDEFWGDLDVARYALRAVTVHSIAPTKGNGLSNAVPLSRIVGTNSAQSVPVETLLALGQRVQRALPLYRGYLQADLIEDASQHCGCSSSTHGGLRAWK